MIPDKMSPEAAQKKIIDEAAMAKAAGLSYGKWKALQPVSVAVGVPEGWKACEYCGELFRIGKKFKKFCCHECCKKAQRTHK